VDSEGSISYSGMNLPYDHDGCSYRYSPVDFCDARHRAAIEDALQHQKPNFNQHYLLVQVDDRPEYFQRTLVLVDTRTGGRRHCRSMPSPARRGRADATGYGTLETGVDQQQFCLDGALLVYRVFEEGRFCFGFDGERFTGHETQYMQPMDADDRYFTPAMTPAGTCATGIEAVEGEHASTVARQRSMWWRACPRWSGTTSPCTCTSRHGVVAGVLRRRRTGAAGHPGRLCGVLPDAPAGRAVLRPPGDRLGRRWMLLASMALMAAAMLATALLPTAATAGDGGRAAAGTALRDGVFGGRRIHRGGGVPAGKRTWRRRRGR
jgi:hypothetical protein